jgi:hypothetical protein
MCGPSRRAEADGEGDRRPDHRERANDDIFVEN